MHPMFHFSVILSLNKAKVLNLAHGEYIRKKENLLLMGNSGTGKTHLATALGLAACQQGRNVRFFTAAGLINQLTEAQAGLRLYPYPEATGQARPVDHRRDRLCPVLGKRRGTLLTGCCRLLREAIHNHDHKSVFLKMAGGVP
jgi:IstB-like ATP binding protein